MLKWANNFFYFQTRSFVPINFISVFYQIEMLRQGTENVMIHDREEFIDVTPSKVCRECITHTLVNPQDRICHDWLPREFRTFSGLQVCFCFVISSKCFYHNDLLPDIITKFEFKLGQTSKYHAEQWCYPLVLMLVSLLKNKRTTAWVDIHLFFENVKQQLFRTFDFKISKLGHLYSLISYVFYQIEILRQGTENVINMHDRYEFIRFDTSTLCRECIR